MHHLFKKKNQKHIIVLSGIFARKRNASIKLARDIQGDSSECDWIVRIYDWFNVLQSLSLCYRNKLNRNIFNLYINDMLMLF